jgi:hypothetical protein
MLNSEHVGLQWLRDLSQTDMDDRNNILPARRYLRNGKREYLKDKIATNSKNKNIRHLFGRINEFKRGYQLRNNLLKDENGNMLADCHNILNRYNN